MNEVIEQIRFEQAQPDGADSRMAVLRERIGRLFRKRGDSPLMRRLERAVLDYRAGKQS